MKKRKIITLIIFIMLIIIGIATKTLHIIIFSIIGLYLLFISIKFLVVKICYKRLLDNTKCIKQIEEFRYKSYFNFTGEQLEDTIEKCDELLIAYHESSNAIIIFLLFEEQYLSKQELNNLLEIAENEIRETSRT